LRKAKKQESSSEDEEDDEYDEEEEEEVDDEDPNFGDHCGIKQLMINGHSWNYVTEQDVLQDLEHFKSGLSVILIHHFFNTYLTLI